MLKKIRKLEFVGPKDSDKTSWAAIFHRIMLADKIVSVTSDVMDSTVGLSALGWEPLKAEKRPNNINVQLTKMR